MLYAAGIMFIARKTGNILFLKRGLGGDHAGEWCFAGGKLEAGETIEECAQREATEELGFLPKGSKLEQWTRTIANREMPPAIDTAAPAPSPSPLIEPEQVDFLCFRQFVDEEFTPKLDHEHVGWAWAPPLNPPEPLHPGCRVALDRLTMDELDVAQAIADGRLTSPQKYENMWLFAMRVTGTGLAYRSEMRDADTDKVLRVAEYVMRDPAHYINDRFMARIMGLPVVMKHPAGKMLSSKDFIDRNIGAIMLPYIKPETAERSAEVWAIARVYDEKAAEVMIAKQLSTSPGVVFRGISGNKRYKDEDGKILLVETDPDLFDHLAVCEQGVWDKGEAPYGIESTPQHGDIEAMADTDDKKEVKKDEGSHGEKLDMILAGLDSASKRFDAMESKMAEQDSKFDAACAKMDAMGSRMDAFEKPEDKKDADIEKEEDKPKAIVADKKDAKKDGEEEDKKEEKKDSFDARKDAAEVRQMIADMDKRIKPRTDAERAAFAEVQSRADDVYSAYADSAPRPMDGEGLADYRRRLLAKFQPLSASYKDAKLELIADDVAFNSIEKHIYADAMNAAMSADTIPAGTLRPHTKKDVTGREITSFYGEPRAWMDQFGGNKRRLKSVRNA